MGTNPNEPISPTTVKQKADYGGDKTAEALLPEFEKVNLVGLTKREYFAGLAIQGLLSTVDIDKFSFHAIAEYSVICADALISELNKEVKP